MKKLFAFVLGFVFVSLTACSDIRVLESEDETTEDGGSGGSDGGTTSSDGGSGIGGAGGCSVSLNHTGVDSVVHSGTTNNVVHELELVITDCGEVVVHQLSFSLREKIGDTDIAPSDGSVAGNFRNVRLQLTNGVTVAGPLEFSSDEWGGSWSATVNFMDEFMIQSHQTTVLRIVVDIPAPLVSDVQGKRFLLRGQAVWMDLPEENSFTHLDPPTPGFVLQD